MQVSTLELFPTTVVVIDDFLNDSELQNFYAVINQHHVDQAMVGTRLRDSDQNLITDDLDWFYQKIRVAVTQHYNLSVNIFEAVYNNMRWGDSLLFHHHFSHDHWQQLDLDTLIILTACYYTNSGDGFAKLRFNNPQLLSRLLGQPGDYSIEPNPNSLLLFPSWSFHGTTIHQSMTVRHCLVAEMTVNRAQK